MTSVSFPLKLGAIVHYRPTGADRHELRAGIVTRLPEGAREAWVKEGQTVDLCLFAEGAQVYEQGVPLNESLDPGTCCPLDTSAARVEETR